MSSRITRMRVQLMHTSASQVVGIVEQALVTISLALRTASITTRSSCGVPDEVCYERVGFDIQPCGHTVCVRHIYYTEDGSHACPVCGTIIDKIVHRQLAPTRPPTFASFFGRAEWAEPPALLLRHMLDDTGPEFHRGMFTGFLSVIQARLKCPIDSFASEALCALEFPSSRECDISPLVGFTLFFIAWRRQLCTGSALDAAAADIIKIALEYGLFGTWTRAYAHPTSSEVAAAIVSMPDLELSENSVNIVFYATVALAAKHKTN